LIANTGTYLGTDMADTATIEKRIDRKGKVELGPLRVIDWEQDAPDDRSKTNSTANQPARAESGPDAPDSQ